MTSLEEVTGGGSSRVWTGANKDTQFAPAVSATAGIAWAMSPGTILDINYRYTYIGAVDTSMPITASDGSTVRSKISVDESHQHVIRAGLRWNIIRSCPAAGCSPASGNGNSGSRVRRGGPAGPPCCFARFCGRIGKRSRTGGSSIFIRKPW